MFPVDLFLEKIKKFSNKVKKTPLDIFSRVREATPLVKVNRDFTSNKF
jgi:hypothetical protein